MSRIIVKNLPKKGVREEVVRKFFEDIDTVTELKLKYNPDGKFRRFAFVGFKSKDAAERAIEKLNKAYISNNRVTLELCGEIRDTKPEKIFSRPEKRKLDDTQDEPTETKKQKKIEAQPTDGDFQEFMDVQRNLGTQKVQIWADDAPMVGKKLTTDQTVAPQQPPKEPPIQTPAGYPENERYKKNEVHSIESTGRLFIRNLNFDCSQNDLEELLSKYGPITEIHMPIDKKTNKTCVGFAYVEFMFPKDGKKAFDELNGTIFQGRNFHIIPSQPKPEPVHKLPVPINQQGWKDSNSRAPMSSFKKEKLLKQKESGPISAPKSNWNILFLGQNAVADVTAESNGLNKSQLLTHQTRKDSIAVRMALGDTTQVDELRRFLVSNGVELDSFDNPLAPRSKTVIIVKNLPKSTTKEEVMRLFDKHGRVSRIIAPRYAYTVLVEMEDPTEAKLAFKRLSYTKFKDSVLYLEWAPMNVFCEKSVEEQDVQDVEQLKTSQTGTKILVKNVPFEATAKELRKLFEVYGELNFVRVPKKNDGQHRGFGFVDYLTKEDALRAFKALGHSTHFYGRKLIIEWAKADE